MYFTPPTTFNMGQLLMLLELAIMLLLTTITSTTLALPVTSKPIENTAENLAWQAWIMLPPEQKLLQKSRKVTPKSIFTLPLRVECPEGHQQVNDKCIPTATGSNAVLIDPNYLGLVLGNNAPLDIEYDYGDYDNDKQEPSNMPYNPPLYLSSDMGGEKSNDETFLELRPPSKDEPLKFNINIKFPTEDYPMEDYSVFSSESAQVPELATNHTMPNVSLSQQFNATANISSDTDLLSEATNVSKIHSLTTMSDAPNFSLDNLQAISLPASSNYEQNSHKISLFNDDTSIHLVTALMDSESLIKEKELETTKLLEKDLETLLQNEALFSLNSQNTTSTAIATATTMQSYAIRTDSEEDQTRSSTDDMSFTMSDEEMTTLPNPMEQADTAGMEQQDKAEFIRSVTINYNEVGNNDDDENDESTTLTPSTSYDEPSESEETTTNVDAVTPIQLDETTIVKNNEVETTTTAIANDILASAAPVTTMPNSEYNLVLKELLLQQEQALKDFEELQRMRKAQNVEQQHHNVLKKSKVEPVEVLSTTTTTTTTSATSVETLPPSEATTMDELLAAETVTPLLAVHSNENDNNDSSGSNNIKNANNNDRFYYQHFAKPDLESNKVSGATTQQQQQQVLQNKKPTTATSTSELEAMATATSEIDLAEELRLINELVKGKQRPSILSSTTTSSATSTSRADESSTTTNIDISTTSDDAKSSSLSPAESTSASTSSSPSESLSSSTKQILTTTQIWSKILPLISTTPKSSAAATTESSTESSSEETTFSTPELASSSSSSTPSSLVVSNRSHRNSKIIRIHGLNSPNSIATTQASSTTQTATTTTEDISSSVTTEEDEQSTLAASADDAYEPFWWLPVAWHFDKPAATATTKKPEQKDDDMPLLLRFWSTYHTPKSS